MADEPVKLGPPPPSGADFYLPPRGAKALDAAEIRIKPQDPTPTYEREEK